MEKSVCECSGNTNRNEESEVPCEYQSPEIRFLHMATVVVVYPLRVAQRRQGGSIRGTRVGSGASSYRGPRESSAPERTTRTEPIPNPEVPREVIDHSLARKAAIFDVLRTGGFNSDALDADPYLLRAAKWHGEATGENCPVCSATELVELTYVFSKELGAFSGRLHPRSEIPVLAKEHGILRVFVVEVCQGCHWNHVVTSYVVGDGIPRRPKRRPSDLDWY